VIPETHDSNEAEAPVTRHQETLPKATLPNRKLTIALIGLAVGLIFLVALNMK